MFYYFLSTSTSERAILGIHLEGDKTNSDNWCKKLDQLLKLDFLIWVEALFPIIQTWFFSFFIYDCHLQIIKLRATKTVISNFITEHLQLIFYWNYALNHIWSIVWTHRFGWYFQFPSWNWTQIQTYFGKCWSVVQCQNWSKPIICKRRHCESKLTYMVMVFVKWKSYLLHLLAGLRVIVSVRNCGHANYGITN